MTRPVSECCYNSRPSYSSLPYRAYVLDGPRSRPLMVPKNIIAAGRLDHLGETLNSQMSSYLVECRTVNETTGPVVLKTCSKSHWKSNKPNNKQKCKTRFVTLIAVSTNPDDNREKRECQNSVSRNVQISKTAGADVLIQSSQQVIWKDWDRKHGHKRHIHREATTLGDQFRNWQEFEKTSQAFPQCADLKMQNSCFRAYEIQIPRPEPGRSRFLCGRVDLRGAKRREHRPRRRASGPIHYLKWSLLQCPRRPTYPATSLLQTYCKSTFKE